MSSVVDDHAFFDEGAVDAGGLVAIPAVDTGDVEHAALGEAFLASKCAVRRAFMMRPRACRSVPT